MGFSAQFRVWEKGEWMGLPSAESFFDGGGGKSSAAQPHLRVGGEIRHGC
jgi:hypothetical protein